MKLKKLLLVSGLAFAMPVSLISLSIASSFERKESVKVNADAPLDSQVYIGGVSFEDGESPYYLNGDTDKFTGTLVNYNARYDSGTGTLYLNNYVGGSIRCTANLRLIVDLDGTNRVNIASEDSNHVRAVSATKELYFQGSGSLTIDVDRESTYYSATGIYAPTVSINDYATVNIDMTGVKKCESKAVETSSAFHVSFASINISTKKYEDQGNSVYGIYAASGNIDFSGDQQSTINFESESNYSSYAIFNDGYDDTKTNNGSIVINECKLVINATGTGYVDGIFSKWHKGDDESDPHVNNGAIEFNGANVEINNCANAVWCQSQPNDDYDIFLLSGTNLVVNSDYEGFGNGLVSQKNGVLIDYSDYYFEGVGRPVDLAGSNGFYNESKVGFDVMAESHVIVRTDLNIHTASDATCDFQLTDSGYFQYTNLQGKFPTSFGSGNFFVKLAPGTRILHPTHFILDGSYGTTTGGGIALGHYSGDGYENDIIEFRPFVIPYSSEITVNGYALSDAKPCYVNGATDTTSDPSGANVRYDYINGVLYLDGYEGGGIAFDSDSGGLLTVDVINDSTITDSRFGFDITGSANLTLFSNNFSYLNINVENNSGDADGVSLESGILTVGGNIRLNVYANVPSTSAGIVKGINVGTLDYGAFFIEDEVSVDVRVDSSHEAVGHNAVYVNGQFVINCSGENNNTLKFNSQYVVGDSYTINVQSASFTKYKELKFAWNHGEAEQCGPTYPSSIIGDINNGAVNVDQSDLVATVKFGTSYHITLHGGLFTNAAQGNYLENTTANFTAPSIDGLTFQNWSNINGSEFVGETQTSIFGQMRVTQNDTVYANYDFVNVAPWFDTRGEADSGYIGFSFKGDVRLIRVVYADGDESSMPTLSCNGIHETTKFTPSMLPGNATYRLAVMYTGLDSRNYWLFTPTFNVTYNQPALDYNVTFHHGDNGTGSDVIVQNHGTYVLPDGKNMFTPNEGYRFLKWALGSTSGTEYSAGTEISITKNLDFYAVYEVIPSHTMSFVGGSGYVSGEMADQIAREGENYTLPTPTFTHGEHMEFDYWEVDDVHYDIGDTIECTKDVIAYAVYKMLPQKQMVFSAGEGTGSMAAQVKYTDENFVLPACSFEAPENFVFSHWLVNGETKLPGEEISATQNYDTVAIYTRIQVTISFSAGDGSGSMDPINYGQGLSYTLPTCTFVAPEGYRFANWQINGDSYNPGDNYAVTGDTVVTAVYEIIPSHTITFVAGEGSGTMSPVNALEGSTYTLPACTFTAPEGKEFDGWMINEVKYNAGAEITITGDVTVTAVWKDIPVTPVDPDNPSTPDTPAKQGLSGGAIAGIVIGSVIVAAIGGFALVWFVFLKKSWADFVAIFKKK